MEYQEIYSRICSTYVSGRYTIDDQRNRLAPRQWGERDGCRVMYSGTGTTATINDPTHCPGSTGNTRTHECKPLHCMLHQMRTGLLEPVYFYIRFSSTKKFKHRFCTIHTKKTRKRIYQAVKFLAKASFCLWQCLAHVSTVYRRLIFIPVSTCTRVNNAALQVRSYREEQKCTYVHSKKMIIHKVTIYIQLFCLQQQFHHS